MKRRFLKHRFLLAVAIVAMNPNHAPAATYFFNTFFRDINSTAALSGTLEIPIGNYTIRNSGPSPFESVDLTLTVRAGSYKLTNALTGNIRGTGEFYIYATPTTLTFDTSIADGQNPATLVFSDNTDPVVEDLFAIGYDASPGFETAITHTGDVFTTINFPIVFAQVPEPSTFKIGAVLFLWYLGHRSSHKVVRPC